MLISLAVRVARWVDDWARPPAPAAHVHLVNTGSPRVWLRGHDGAMIEDYYFELGLD